MKIGNIPAFPMPAMWTWNTRVVGQANVDVLHVGWCPQDRGAGKGSPARVVSQQTGGLANLSLLQLGGDKNLGADMTPRTVFATLLVAFAIASICAGLTTARQLHEQALNAPIISRG